MELLREPHSPEVSRARFDSVWLSFRPDKREAAALINRYYSRVEEANRRFTSTKEGWRTDQGMIFAILGPPVQVMNTKDRQVWYYDLGGQDASNVYVFQRRFVQDNTVMLETYHLFRQMYYEVFWERMVEKWRSGEYFRHPTTFPMVPGTILVPSWDCPGTSLERFSILILPNLPILPL